MTEVDRELGLALLKRLRQRELISEETFVSACNSRFFDAGRFARYVKSAGAEREKEDFSRGDHTKITGGNKKGTDNF